MNKKKRIGITGGIGAGKSLICSIIHTMGYPVFYSDKEAKKIVNSDPNTILAIKKVFGPEAYVSTGLNRPYIAEKVFNDQALLNAINQIVHPAVRKAFDEWAEKQTSELVFNEAAILFETGGYKDFDATVLVTASTQTRITRVMKRDGISAEEVSARMSKQWKDDRKAKLADYIVINDAEHMLIPQVIELLTELKKT